MKKTITEIMNKDDHLCVLAVSHAGACAAFYNTVADYTTFRKEYGRLMNCDILHFQFKNDTFTFVELLRI